jgi:predicted Zn-dependent protease
MAGFRGSFVGRVLVLLVCSALVVSCATTQLPPITAAGAGFQPTSDEVALWNAAREEEQKLRREADLYHDPLLLDYLEDIVARLNPPGMAANPELSYRVSVIEDPTLNAFAYPHGSLYVHTGLLARMENEDQLATVLGHEMTHVDHRHLLEYQRAQRNRAIAFSAAAIAAAIWVAGEQGKAIEEGDYSRAARIDVLSDVLIGLGLQLAFVAAVNGYGRKLEREADDEGMRKLAAAGYDVGEADDVFVTLREASPPRSDLEVFFFGSHPQLEERIENTREWQATHQTPPGQRSPAEPDRFETRMRPVIRDNAALNIALGRLDLAATDLERVRGMMPDDPRTLMLFGRLRMAEADRAAGERQRRSLIEAAMDAYRDALSQDDSLAEPHRELGLHAYRQRRVAEACAHFQRYLDLAPRSAEDIQAIEDYVRDLDRSGHCR